MSIYRSYMRSELKPRVGLEPAKTRGWHSVGLSLEGNILSSRGARYGRVDHLFHSADGKSSKYSPPGEAAAAINQHYVLHRSDSIGPFFPIDLGNAATSTCSSTLPPPHLIAEKWWALRGPRGEGAGGAWFAGYRLGREDERLRPTFLSPVSSSAVPI